MRVGGLAAESLGAPERLVVHHERLALRAGDRGAVQLSAVVGEHRVERDLEREGGRHAHDRVPGRDLEVAGVDEHAFVALRDQPDGRVEPHRVAELGGDLLRDRTGAAVDEILLRALLDREQVVDAAVRAHEEQQVQERRVVQVAGEEPAHRHLEEVAPDALVDARLLDVLGDRLRVPLDRLLRGPRRVERHLPRHPVDLHLRPGDAQHRERADLRDESRVLQAAVAVDQQMRAVDVGLVRRDADFRREPERRVVVRREPRAAAVDRRAVGERLRSRRGRRRGRALRARRPTCPAG